MSGQWTAETWHHCALTWNSEAVRVYVDGEGSAATINGTVDELRISDMARSTAEIADSYMRRLQITGLAITPDPLQLAHRRVPGARPT